MGFSITATLDPHGVTLLHQYDAASTKRSTQVKGANLEPQSHVRLCQTYTKTDIDVVLRGKAHVCRELMPFLAISYWEKVTSATLINNLMCFF